MLPWRTATGWPSTSASTSTSVAVALHPGGADEDGLGAAQSGQVELGLEGVQLAPEGVAPRASRRAGRGARGRA